PCRRRASRAPSSLAVLASMALRVASSGNLACGGAKSCAARSPGRRAAHPARNKESGFMAGEGFLGRSSSAEGAFLTILEPGKRGKRVVALLHGRYGPRPPGPAAEREMNGKYREEMSAKRVLSVGQCAADHGLKRLKTFLGE